MAIRIKGQNPSTISEEAERMMMRFRRYWQKVDNGEIPDPVKHDAKGNIIPSPSGIKPNMFTGLHLNEDTPAEIA